MASKRIKITLVAVASVATIFAALIGYMFWPLDTRAHLYKSATSPDGAWTVNLYRGKRSHDLLAPVYISVQVTDRAGKLAYADDVYIVDAFRQAPEYCSYIEFAGNEIQLGPGRMYADGPGVRVIKTADLKPKRLRRTQSNKSLHASRDSVFRMKLF